MVQIICSVAEGLSGYEGFTGWLLVWMTYTLFGYAILTGTSIASFIYYYGYPTYDKWRYKTNPKYPSPTYVLGEVFLGGILGPPSVTLVASLHLVLIANGTMKHHCDTPQTWGYRIFSGIFVFVGTDLYEWGWHYLGHAVERLWSVHRHHHKYYNPTPFGTVADWPMDNIMRSLYVVVPNLVSYSIFGVLLDVDMVYFVAGGLFASWGLYLHCGHELACLPHDHCILNTSYQHYVHHAISVKNKPYHTGFFVKVWDQLAGSVYCGKQVIPAVEDQKLGNRSRERWEKDVAPNLPDYSVLLSPSWWASNWHLAPGLQLWAMSS
jgi:lathosterol oxidase